MIVLASRSATRLRLLRDAAIEVEAVPSTIDERAVEEALGGELGPTDLAEMLAETKAQEVSGRRPGDVVIGADQVLALDGEILHQVEDMEGARRRLLQLQGRTHRLHTAHVVMRDGAAIARHSETADMTMRPLTPAEVGRAMARDEGALHSVGCYRLEGPGVRLFTRIEGDHFAILGLAMLPLLDAPRGPSVSDGGGLGGAPRAFVIGHPIGHSRSPLIHRHWLDERCAAGAYEAVDVAPDDLVSWLDGLDPAEWAGGNVTAPHKEAVRAWLGGRADSDAVAIGAVNTLWRQGGSWRGGCTDGTGFLANLDDHAPGWRDRRSALVIGAGGAARAVVHALRGAGLAVTVANRTLARAEALADEFELDRAMALDAVADVLPGAGLVVNAATLGMAGTTGDAAPHLDPAVLARAPAGAVAADIVYVPLRTAFLLAAEAAGLATVDGLGMLLHQAVPGHERWFGVRPEVNAELRTAVEATL